jgi:hypothetical protein
VARTRNIVDSRGALASCVAFALFALAAGCGASSRTIPGKESAGGSGGSSGSTTGGSSTSGGSGEGGGTGGSSTSGGTGGSTTPDAGEGGAGAQPEPGCTPGGIPGTSQIPRLTNAQYDRTVRDLLQVTTLTAYDSPPSTLLAPDDTLPLSSIGWQGYWAAGEAIAKQVLADPALQGRFLACPAAEANAQCLHDSVVAFGRRAFRRPLTADEVARFDAITARGAELTPTGAPLEIAEVLLNTFLVAPSFLQRAEITGATDQEGNFVLSPYEVASRLSFMLWGSTPDEILEQAADANQLETPEQLREQAVRLLADPRAREPVTAFHHYYVQDQYWSSKEKDPALFPAFSDAVASAMLEETERFFDHVVFEQRGTFADFFTSHLGYVNAATAPIYGLDPAAFGEELEAVELDATRPGFLTRVGFLAGSSYYDASAPIIRGAIIMRLIGADVGTYGHDLAVLIPPPPPEVDTERERAEWTTAGAACAACHSAYVNPPGYVLEAFDAIGAAQTTDRRGGAIDTAADVFIDGEAVAIASPAELMQRISESRFARREYAKRLISYAYERDTHPLDACAADTIGTKLTEGGYTVLDLLVDLTQTDSFRLRVRETP